LFFIFGPFGHHVTEFCDGPGSLTAEISEDVVVEKALVVANDDVVFSDVGNGDAVGV
jgi:hypothetical protein